MTTDRAADASDVDNPTSIPSPKDLAKPKLTGGELLVLDDFGLESLDAG
jgi:hypothetical protein